jgi:hypothetical protein
MLPKKRVGRIQLRVKRALLLAGRPLTSAEILPFVYPRWAKKRTWSNKRFEYWHFDNVRRAAPKFARLVGRKGRQPIWALKEWESDCS